MSEALWLQREEGTEWKPKDVISYAHTPQHTIIQTSLGPTFTEWILTPIGRAPQGVGRLQLSRRQGEAGVHWERADYVLYSDLVGPPGAQATTLQRECFSGSMGDCF